MDRKIPLNLAALLTPKELQVLTLLHKGLSTRQIAKESGANYNTVRSHMRNIQMKTGMNRIELVVAMERMLITEGETA